MSQEWAKYIAKYKDIAEYKDRLEEVGNIWSWNILHAIDERARQPRVDRGRQEGQEEGRQRSGP